MRSRTRFKATFRSTIHQGVSQHGERIRAAPFFIAVNVA
jgi:hypothetical protein